MANFKASNGSLFADQLGSAVHFYLNLPEYALVLSVYKERQFQALDRTQPGPILFCGRDQVLWVQQKALIESGNPRADLRLRRDNVIYVLNMAERFVSVLAEVQYPVAIPLTNASTLASVLAMAGGITEKAGGKPQIQIVDPVTGTTRVPGFKDLLDPAKSQRITLRRGEIIEVPQSGIYRAAFFLERLSPLTQLAPMATINGQL